MPFPRTERAPRPLFKLIQTEQLLQPNAGSDCAALPPSIRHSRRVRSNGSSSATPGSASSAARRRRAASLELEDHAAFPLVDGSEEEDSWDEYFRVSSEFISKDESPGVGLGRRLSMNPTTFTP